MQTTNILPLSDIVRIDVNLAPMPAMRRGFNIGLIIGQSGIIPRDERVRLYSSLESMAGDGFNETMPEYIAARYYFSQRQRPQRVAIGAYYPNHGYGGFSVLNAACQPKDEKDNTYRNKYEIYPDYGTDEGYSLLYKKQDSADLPAYGDELDKSWKPLTDTIKGKHGDYVAICEINDETREVKSVALTQLGNSDDLTPNLPPAESITSMLRAARAANTSWYLFTVLDASSQDILSAAQWCESAKPESVHFFTTDEDKALRGATDGIFSQLRLRSFMRSMGQYSITPYAVCGIMGWAMGSNTRLSDSAFTLKHVAVVGIPPDDISETQMHFIIRQNGNFYVARGFDFEYQGFEDGRMANGVWFDEVLNLDMLVNDMQLAILERLASRPKVPQTEHGVNQIKMAMEPSLRRARMIGFIAPGQWNGPGIKTQPDYWPLQTGDMLETGYLILSEPVNQQSPADRARRLAPPIYVAIKLAGAIHTVHVRVDVDR